MEGQSENQTKDDKVLIQEEEAELSDCFNSAVRSLLYWDKKHHLTWCKVPKAGSTTWVENFYKLAGAPLPQDDSIDWWLVHKMLRSHYPNTPKKDIPEMLSSSLLFTFVRHPLERFLSSYRDKIELNNATYFHSLFGEPDYQLDFPKFVSKMLDTPVESWDWHWAPIHRLCPPCANYHVVGKMETFTEDTQYIVARAGLTDILDEVPLKNKKSSGSIFQLHFSYYRQLSRHQLDRLVDVYREDFRLYGYDPQAFQWMADQNDKDSQESDIDIL